MLQAEAMEKETSFHQALRFWPVGMTAESSANYPGP
jgi:hypothetical protein